ncbi:SNF2 family N-terminal domain-containing protein [Aspergillus californicus]
MAEVPPLVGHQSAAAELAAARARRKPEYAKEAIARARRDVQQQTSDLLPQENTQPNASALPPLTGLVGQPLQKDVDMLDVFADANTSSAPEYKYIDTAEDSEDAENFQSIEKWFKELKTPTMADRVRHAAARRKLDISNKRSESRRNLENEDKDKSQQGEETDMDLFVRSDNGPAQVAQGQQQAGKNAQAEDPAPTQIPKKRKQYNRLSAEEKRKSMEVGFEPTREKLDRKNKRGKKPQGIDFKNDVASKQGRGRKKRTKHSETDLVSTLQPNVVHEAHESSALPELGPFTSRSRKNAIAELVASIPSADYEELKDEQKMLEKAPRNFNNQVRSDRQGGWKMAGLKTSMYSYQLLGCAWMRDRENSCEEPRGGLLCDEMGFGKTFEALVNIMDGFPSDPDDPVKTTLIVAPSHLTQHWMDQMREHCHKDYIVDAVEYHAHARLSTLDVVNSLLNYRVVVTTYEQIRRSYPAFKPLKEIVDTEMLHEQWKIVYEEQRGPLHRIKWHRIVLDEAHIIKNRDAGVSIAVRGLTARYKWALSGTPVHNSTEEFYPLLHFLGVPQIKDYEHYLRHFSADSEEGIKRLNNMLRTYMFRRTHASRFMSLPIIKLPDISETRIDIQFSNAEEVLYTAIEQMFVDQINDLAAAPNYKLAQCRCSLTMILRLRMFCSHLLTVQHIIKHLMRSGSVVHNLVESAKQEEFGFLGSSAEIVYWLKALKSNYNNLLKQRETDDPSQTGENPLFNRDPSLLGKFYNFMQQLPNDESGLEQISRGICPKCTSLSDKGVVTSCLHLYCEECFAQLYNEAERLANDNSGVQAFELVKPVCLTCNTLIDAVAHCNYVEGSEQQSVLPSIPATRKERSKALVESRKKAKQNDNLGDEDEDDDKVEDWIAAAGDKMPSAKLSTIREKIKEWKSENKDTKVVIFSQFTDFIRILGEMCKSEDWQYRSMIGKMRIPIRLKNLEDFKTDPNITILIVSLHTGGTGLDMTVAHKCILVDLWWNEAIQNQAFCRLLRHGQTQNVECVKMVVAGSIDDQMLELQQKKTTEINSAMSEEILEKRDTVIDLLNMFADVTEDSTGRLRVTRLPRDGRKRKSKAIAPPPTAEE